MGQCCAAEKPSSESKRQCPTPRGRARGSSPRSSRRSGRQSGGRQSAGGGDASEPSEDPLFDRSIRFQSRKRVHIKIAEGVKFGVTWRGSLQAGVILAAAVEPGGVAAQAGMQRGWQLVNVDGIEVVSQETLVSALETVRKRGGGCFLMVPTYSPRDVAKHKVPGDCWVIVREKVFDVSGFVAKHPGGAELLMRHVGGDATRAFDEAHAGHPNSEAATILDGFFIGNLRPEELA